MAAQFLFSPTGSYYPVYNQLQFGLQSNNYTRGSFRFLTDIYVDNLRIEPTLVSNNVPGKTWSNVDIRRIVQTTISYDKTWNVVGATYTPESIKSLRVEVGEEFNNTVGIIGITLSTTSPYIGWTKLLLTDTSRINVGDRVQVDLDDGFTNPELNDFWKVLLKDSVSITIDQKGWVWPGFTQVGRVKEGFEFYDASFNSSNGSVIIETTNPNSLKPGDSFQLQLDPYAVGYISVNSVSGLGTINSMQINAAGITYSLITSPISGASTASLAQNLATAINGQYSPTFSAFNNTGDRPWITYIYSNRKLGDSWIGSVPTFSTTNASLSAFAMSKNPKSGPIGGWNGFSGFWKVIATQSNTKFTTAIPWQNSTITGSQRGTILPFSNFKSSGDSVIGDKWIMNHSWEYENFFNYPNPSRNLDLDPRDCQTFSDWKDFRCLDIMTLLGPSGMSASSFLMRTTYPIGGTFFDYNYTLGIVKGNKEPRLSFGVGPGNLNPLSSTFSSTKPQSYRIEIFDNFGNLFWRQDFCYKCRTGEYFRVMWLNKRGGWDFYDFNYANKSLSGEKQSFYRAIGDYNGSSWVKEEGERGLTVYDNRTYERFLLYTDLLAKAEGDWLVGLFESPEVYLFIKGKATPLIIENEEIVRFGRGERIRQLQFEARLAFNNISQIN